MDFIPVHFALLHIVRVWWVVTDHWSVVSGHVTALQCIAEFHAMHWIGDCGLLRIVKSW